MPNPATTADIEARWRSLTDAETTIATTRLEDAWRKLKKDIPSLEARMVDDDDLTADVVRVLSDAVIRLLQANERGGLKRGTVQVDDGSTTWEADDYARAALYFTESELGDLSPTGKTGRARAFSVMPS